MSTGGDGGGLRLRSPLRRRGNVETKAAEATRAPQRLRASLIVNPYSSGLTSRREVEIVRILREACNLDVMRTERPGHAIELAREACEEGVDVVVACGGDGTGNEVVNGMTLSAHGAGHAPRFALVPAGGTNVLCRAVGLPNNPITAAGRITEALRADRSHVINLGVVDERRFLFACGVGMDGEMVRRVDARRTGRRPSDLAHVSTLVGIFASERFRLTDRMTIHIDDTGEELRGCLLMCGNTTPTTYLGRIGMHFMPDCRLETGLDFVAPRQQNALAAIRNSARSIRTTRRSTISSEQLRHDLRAFSVECDEPQPCQVDGEYIGDRTHLRFELLERCLRLVY